VVPPQAPGDLPVGPAAAVQLPDLGPRLEHRVDRVVGAAAGMAVRPAVIARLPDSQSHGQVFDVVASADSGPS